ncbi:cytochrome c biogenesis CcdA family protein [Antribacter gilvus]|uniref:cytochrome c biogenesis CcdA family protein n=1 Tax=Antribacter gilvus TaxID=2304675 RepID=UPI000F7B6658|nr:cytochrome c biogenesis CcdA family protein [Antribacter gilvus]
MSQDLALALGAGLVAAANPCGFALLPAYLSLMVLDGPGDRRSAVGRALRSTAALTAGFVAVFAVFGLVVAPVASAVQQYLPAFTVVLGVALVLAGGWVVAGRELPGLRLGRGPARPVTGSLASTAAFGASYAIASLGCTIAPFLAVVVTAFRSGSVGEGIALFAAYAAGMGLLVGCAAVGIALAGNAWVARARSAGRWLPRVGGALLLVAGAYVAWYGAWELRVLHGGAGADPVVEAAGQVQRSLAGAVEWIGPAGLVVLLVVLAALGLGIRAVGMRSRRLRERRREDA